MLILLRLQLHDRPDHVLHMAENALVILGAQRVQLVRKHLERAGYFDHTRRITADSKTGEVSKFAIPLNRRGVNDLSQLFQSDQSALQGLQVLSELISAAEGSLAYIADLPPSKKSLSKDRTEHAQLVDTLRQKVAETGNYLESETSRILEEIPQTWERHGDLVVLPKGSFESPLWQFLGQEELWRIVAASLRCSRLAVGGRVSCDGFRSSAVEVVLGEDGWVEHLDNGVKYVFDVTKCMFSSGNITEKIRMAKLKCSGETIVDLYAGIGYFTLPVLVHAGAKAVHACDWNPHAVEALERGLTANGVAGRCTVHFGDNRKVAPRGLADRVFLGLIPSSEAGWPTACAALNPNTGGWLHVHGNVSTHTKPDSLAPLAERNLWELSGKENYSHKDRLNVQEDGSPITGLLKDTEITSPKKNIEPIATSDRTCVPDIPKDAELFHLKENVEGASQPYLLTLHDPQCVSEFPKDPELSHLKENLEGAQAFQSKPSDDASYQSIPSSWSWSTYVAGRIRELLTTENPLPSGREWLTEVRHVERVKSYAPHVYHLVADIECRPVASRYQ